MIDIENEVFTILYNAILDKNVFVTSEYVPIPPRFPCVSIVEIDNQIYRNTRSSSTLENHAQVVYEINVYSNKSTGKKSECKAILSLLDKEMGKLGFTRVMSSPVSNIADNAIYRICARYRAVVSKDKKIYRR